MHAQVSFIKCQNLRYVCYLSNFSHFCAVGVAEGRDITPNSIASALFDSYNIVNIVLDSKNTYAADLQNMQKIKSAFELGQVSRKAELCNQVFECTNRDVDIAMPDLARTERVDCSGLGQVCPGVSYNIF